MQIRRINKIEEQLTDEDGKVLATAKFIPTSATFIIELQTIHNGFKNLVNKVTDVDNSTREDVMELSEKLKKDLDNCFGTGVAEALQQGTDDFTPVVDFLAWVKECCDVGQAEKQKAKEQLVRLD